MSKDALNESEISQRLGTPTALAEAAVVEFSRRTFWGRHPVLMFVFAPIPLAVLAWAATFAAGIGCAAGISRFSEWLGVSDAEGSLASWPATAVWGIPVLFLLAVTVPPALVTALLCRMGRASGLSWQWSLAGCVLVALIAGMFQANLDLPIVPGAGRLMLGFGFWRMPPVRQVLQFALPLTIGLGLLWRQARAAQHRPPSPLREARLRQAA